MDIDTGKIYNPGDIEELKKQMSILNQSFVEIHESDMNEEEEETSQVQLDGDSKLARYARDFRNLRRFVQFKGKKRKS